MIKQKKWSDLPTAQKLAALLVALVQYALLVAALWDMWHRPTEEINGDRRLWTAAAFVNFIGPIAYFVAGRKR